MVLALLLTFRAASATHVTTAANVPNSGIAPGHVNMATGELILVMRPDLVLDGPIPVVFQRYYASMLARDGFASSHLGTNWLGTYDWKLTLSPPNATVVTNVGKRIQFIQSPLGSWDLVSPTDAKYRLSPIGAGSWLFTHPLTRRVYLFDGATGFLTQIIDEHMNSLSLTYSGGLLAQVRDGLGRTLNFGYDGSGLLTLVSDGTRSVSFEHTGPNLLTSVTDATGLMSTYSYAPSLVPGLLASVIETLGNAPFTYSYDPSGRVSARADASMHSFAYTYDAPTGSRFTDALTNTWTYSHDPLDRLITLIDPNTGSTTFTYDPLGRLAAFHRPLGDSTSFAYDPASGYVSSLTRTDGLSFGFQYSSHSVSASSFFDIRVASFPDATSEIYDRDGAGNVMTFTDREGFPWNGTYNSRGQLLTWTNPTGGVTTFTYDPLGRPDTRLEAGHTTRYTFDSFSRLTQIAWPDGPTRSYAYNNADQMTSLTDERGKIWSYGYDDDHRLVSATDPLLHSVQLVWNADDRVSNVVDGLTHPNLYGYDANGRLSSITDRTSRTIGFQYDGLNRLAGIMNATGATWSGSYDADSRMISWQDPLSHGVIIGHDFLDRVTHVTDPVLSPFDFGYDTMGRLLTVTAPLDQSDVMAYDRRGLMTSYRHVVPQTDMQRNPLGEISVVTDPNRFRWPANYDPDGRPTDDADPLGRLATYFYDARSRLALLDLPEVGGVNFTYDPASRLTDCQWLDGTTFTYTYDDANRVTAATGASFAYDAGDRMTSSNGLSMDYDFEGRITSETFVPGKTVSYSYNNRGLLSTISDWVGGTTTFTYDTAERLAGMTRANGTAVEYTYDAADRLISAVEKNPGPPSAPISSIAITRDALGRPTSIDRRQPLMPVVTSPGSTEFAYDPASQITGLSWDGLARLTSDGTRSFVWDGASRLTHYVAGADSPSFTYDAYGRMLSRSLGAATEQYVWNYAHGMPTLDAVYQGPTARKFYVYTPSGLLLYSVEAATGNRRFYHYDEDGNTTFLTNDAGSVTTEYAYTPFGGMSSLGATADNPFTWGAAAGMMQIGSGGSLYSKYGSTIYDSRLMRLISGGAATSGYPPSSKLSFFPNAHMWTESSWSSPGSRVRKDPGPIQDASTAQWAYIGLESNPWPVQSPGAEGNLKALFTNEKAFFQEKDVVEAPISEVPFSPEPRQSLSGVLAMSALIATGIVPVGLPPGPCSPGSRLTKDPGPISIGDPNVIGDPGIAPVGVYKQPGPIQLGKDPGPINLPPGPCSLGSWAIRDLGTLPGFSNSAASAIAHGGHVGGWSYGPIRHWHWPP